MFSLQSDDINNAVTDTGAGDAGVFVKVTNGNLDAGPTVYDNTFMSYLGVDPSSLPYVGRDQYPRVPITVGAAADGDQPLGITLYQTAKVDENGEKLLYYPQKKIETQSVLPGEAVPVLTRGIIAVAASTGALPPNTANSACVLNVSPAFTAAGGVNATEDIVGSGVELSAAVGGSNADANGQLVISQANRNNNIVSGVIGHILATGSRVVTSGQTADQFAGKTNSPTAWAGSTTKSYGYYAIIQFDAVQATHQISYYG